MDSCAPKEAVLDGSSDPCTRYFRATLPAYRNKYFNHAMMVYGIDATLYQITLDTCILTYYYYYTRLTASFSGQPW